MNPDDMRQKLNDAATNLRTKARNARELLVASAEHFTREQKRTLIKQLELWNRSVTLLATAAAEAETTATTAAETTETTAAETAAAPEVAPTSKKNKKEKKKKKKKKKKKNRAHRAQQPQAPSSVPLPSSSPPRDSLPPVSAEHSAEQLAGEPTAAAAAQNAKKRKRKRAQVEGEQIEGEPTAAAAEQPAQPPAKVPRRFAPTEIVLPSNSALEETRIFLASFCDIVSSSRDGGEDIYNVTQTSLYNAAAIGLTPVSIDERLRKFSHHYTAPTNLDAISTYIKKNFRSCGQLYRSAKQTFVRFTDADTRQHFDTEVEQHGQLSVTQANTCSNPSWVRPIPIPEKEVKTLREHFNEPRLDGVGDAPRRPQLVETYDYARDSELPSLQIALRQRTNLYAHQKRSLERIFYKRGDKAAARSGMIVLPCGAGKTLVGIATIAKLARSALILCTSTVAVEQWYEQFRQWSTIPAQQIFTFTSKHKNVPSKTADYARPMVVITTYNMVAPAALAAEMLPDDDVDEAAAAGKAPSAATKQTAEILAMIMQREWGCVMFDEVQVAPASTFQKCAQVHTKLKIGLTATLVREDTLTEDLYNLIGPKLYEELWLSLERAGLIAQAFCYKVTVELPRLLRDEYDKCAAEDRAGTGQRMMRYQRLLCAINPKKLRACEYLVRFHEKLGHKILIFSDSIAALKHYARQLGVPFIYGQTPIDIRLLFYNKFKYTNTVNTLCLSQAGDNAIDLPDANVLIQINSKYGSRQQEGQRIGRILRRKRDATANDAYFYTLLCKDTREIEDSERREHYMRTKGDT